MFLLEKKNKISVERSVGRLGKSDTFFRPSIPETLCAFGTEDFRIFVNFGCLLDFFCHDYGKIVSCFRHFTKDKILQRYKTPADFRTKNFAGVESAIVSIFFVCDFRYQKIFLLLNLLL